MVLPFDVWLRERMPWDGYGAEEIEELVRAPGFAYLIYGDEYATYLMTQEGSDCDTDL